MSLQGYIDEEAEAEEERGFVSQWQKEQNRVARTVPILMREVLFNIYHNTPHERLAATSSQFVDDITWRVYTEWCMSEESKGKNPADYTGEALTRFIDDEIYLASERASKKGLLEQPPLNENPGEKITAKVLEGLVKRAIELFSDWNGNTQLSFKRGGDRIYGDKRNLRCDLEPYIGF